MKKCMSILLLVFCSFALLANGSNENANGADHYDLIMGTAGTAGTYYVVGAAMGTAISSASDLITVIVQPTKGSMENINMANTNDIQLGFSNSDGVYWAATGTGIYEDLGKQNIKAVMNLYTSQCQMVTLANSGIKTYGDLKGKKVNVGPAGQTIVEVCKAILREYGIDPEKDITPFYLSVDEGMSKLKDGDIDASFFAAAAPTAGVVNIATTTAVRMVDIDQDVLDRVCEKYPFYQKGVLSAGTYKGQTEDVNVVDMVTEIFASAAVPEDAIYEFVKQTFECKPQYVSAHVSAQEITPEFASQCVVELHPGALKYYQEHGLR